jgi:ArsR family transcriptional regulator
MPILDLNLDAAPYGELAQRFHALSDETRLRILHVLKDGERCVGDLAPLVDASQSRLSFHLRTLKQAGLVTDRKAGRWSYYAIVPATLDELSSCCTQWCRPHEAPA